MEQVQELFFENTSQEGSELATNCSQLFYFRSALSIFFPLKKLQ